MDLKFYVMTVESENDVRVQSMMETKLSHYCCDTAILVEIELIGFACRRET
jgi:hypothetical protein